jgi:hypothetical protein
MWVGPNKEKFQIHLELDRKVYWNLVQEAAINEQHPEEYLKAYLETMWNSGESLMLFKDL